MCGCQRELRNDTDDKLACQCNLLLLAQLLTMRLSSINVVLVFVVMPSTKSESVSRPSLVSGRRLIPGASQATSSSTRSSTKRSFITRWVQLCILMSFANESWPSRIRRLKWAMPKAVSSWRVFVRPGSTIRRPRMVSYLRSISTRLS